MFERFTDEARAVVVGAQEEARALGHNYVGTEHLLLGLLRDRALPAGAALARLGVDREAVRADVLRIIGHGGRLDGGALAAIGIDLDEVRRRVEAAFGPGALDAARPGCRDPRLAFTPRSKKALELALREAASRRAAAVGGEHLLFGLLRLEKGVAAEILGRRGVTTAAIEAELRRAA
jgi:ATP-dependent Clp protease ATP-binding subunit ClpA